MAKTTPLVSIVMPCYKMGRYIGGALFSVGCQSHDAWEVIVVDDCGPDDGTHATVESFAARFAHHRVEYLRHERNSGVSAARNTAIATARGEFVAFLDPDDAWFPDHLSKSIAGFLSHGADVAVVTSTVELFWDDEMKVKPRPRTIAMWARERFPASLASHNFIQPSATLVRRDALQAVGGFDVTPALQHIEDYDLWIRLAEKGYRFAFLDGITSRYRQHATAATADLEKGRQRNEALCELHMGFFMRTQGNLLREAFAELERTSEEIERLKSALRNPFRWLTDQGRRRLNHTLSRLKART